MRVFRSEEFGVVYEESREPVFIVVALRNENGLIAVHLGMKQRRTEEEAIRATLEELGEVIYISAQELMSFFAEAETIRAANDVVRKFDSLTDLE